MVISSLHSSCIKAQCLLWVLVCYTETINKIKCLTCFLFSSPPFPSSLNPPFHPPTHIVSYQEVAVGERSRGGRLLEEPKMMLFRGNTFSLQVSIQDVPQLLWSIKPFTTCQVAAYNHNVCICVCVWWGGKGIGISQCKAAASRLIAFKLRPPPKLTLLQRRRAPSSALLPLSVSHSHLVASKPKDGSKGTAGDHRG